ncbi:hypothetical protein LXL04_003115 [Taraxacum kok-saghyz]
MCGNIDCEWRIHGSIMQDGVTFQVKKMVENHTCTQTFKGESGLCELYHVDVPYLKVCRELQKVHIDKYKKNHRRNQGSIIKIHFDIVDKKKLCSQGFLAGCRPYIRLDACHLKEKFSVVLAAATTGIDGNNSIFLVAYSMLKSENSNGFLSH